MKRIKALIYTDEKREAIAEGPKGFTSSLNPCESVLIRGKVFGCGSVGSHPE